MNNTGPSNAAPPVDERLGGLIVHVLVRRIAVEAGPLLVFFVAFYVSDIFVATGAFMAATAVAVAASLWTERRWPILPFISLALVLAFGGLTLLTDDPRFIMVRPTIVNGVYGVALLASMGLEKSLLERLLSPGLKLDVRGWRLLTLRLGLFFLLQGALNEIVWRNLGTESWVVFKTFVTIPLNVSFVLSQIPMIRKHRLSVQHAPAERP